MLFQLVIMHSLKKLYNAFHLIAEAAIDVPIKILMHNSFPSQLIWAYHVRKFEDTNVTIRSSKSKGRQHDEENENNGRQSNATKTQNWATGTPPWVNLPAPSGAHRVTVKRRHEINDSSNNAQLTFDGISVHILKIMKTSWTWHHCKLTIH
jgi:hypothetical protein